MQDQTAAPARIAEAIEALPPVTMLFEAFCKEAVARVAAVDPQLICLASANHWPANSDRNGVERTDYLVQVWSGIKGVTLMGTNMINVGSSQCTAEQCLHELGRELAALKAKRDYDATQQQ